ncbi:indolepyruvate ferredoxin oxidoreductase subunit alpha [Methanosarcina sp. 2.H.A.1B.4]|uniref:thiamine pyrophosphate-dependent enzyme n=1 Tax=Methanosarcina sp. 2.H.A.1B.4 TaxID=1483600 RepID=UPI000622B40C|nr:indolepyruvate ferredoxin oxidoreductase subunit alpha [Methanosarcina sp. 2.H.A.1B.4]KKG12506.1 indolepyruvate ferredoxin oxidoreductase [Methanosarcina sp. 2.H.A.1B.4]
MKEEAALCNGFEALYLAAIDSDVTLITGVPGYPVTSLMELFLKTDNPSTNAHSPTYRARWLTNEKVALEIALGASVSGKRALVLVKHVGMNLLSDPLITSVTHTIGAGLVIIAGDDPGVKGSQNEQDSRWYGRIAEVAVFDPADPDAAYRTLRRAYELSEETRVPVILRVTAGLEKSKGKVRRLPASSTVHPGFDRSIWGLRMVEKHQHFHSKVYPVLEAEAEKTDLNEIKEGTQEIEAEAQTSEQKGVERIKGVEWIGIISSGFAASIVEDTLKKSGCYPGVSHLVLNLVNPLPLQKIGNFLKNNRRVLVAEESEPFIEEQIRISGNVCGKKTGHLPYGQIMLEDIEFALEHIEEDKVSRPADFKLIESRKKGRASICEDCPYLPLYHFLRILDIQVAGDMGCSVRSASEPLAAVDVSFALGSAISVACGFEKKGIAVIGDFALAHSGILGLLNAASEGYEVLVLVLQNEVAAMTGGQKVPELRKVVEAIVPDVSFFDLDVEDGEEGKESGDREKEGESNTGQETVKEMEKEGKKLTPGSELSDLILEKLALPGISVIFIKGRCRKY